jgi:N-acyl-D-amino-acid deacylase
MIFKRPLCVSVCGLALLVAAITGNLTVNDVVADQSSQADSSAPKPSSDTKPHLDIAICGGRIVDGSGTPWYRADIGIRDGKIVSIGRIAAGEATRMIDATGLVVSPGFIDMMGQSATSLLESPTNAMNLLSQGITTINCGEGVSAAPLAKAEGDGVGWTTMREYLALLDMKGLPVNVVQTVGHTQVRRLVLGDVDRRPSDEELQQMRELVREAMTAGAIGVSTALIYPPAIYAQSQEIAALAKVAGEYGGGYFTHMRNEGDQLLEAIDEALEIGRMAGTPVHVFHLKTAGRQNWGKMPLAIARIQAARASGQQVTADIYPYIHNGLGISALIHPRHSANGFAALRERLDDETLRAEIRVEMEQTDGWENWFRHVGSDWDKIIVGQATASRYQSHVGKSLAAVAAAVDEDPWVTFFELVKTGAFVLPESMTEANKILAMRQDFISFCTDVGPAGGESIASHPRAYGAFPRLLARYVRDLGVLSLERAIAQATAVAANDVMAFDRGRIAVGLAADIVAFDYEKLADRADFTTPTAIADGVRYVIVGGQVVLDEGKQTESRPGRVLRGPGFRPDSLSVGKKESGGHPTLAAFDEMASRFLEKHRSPGMAIAVTDGGRLVHAAGYGYADLSEGETVKPDSLFRIASISKPITAVAIMQLVEQGRVGLEDPVIRHVACEGDFDSAGETCDPRWRLITIRQLLEHQGGWDRDKSFDAMFQSVKFAEQLGVKPPAASGDVIRAMITQPLDFDPGTRYAYSNFGYNLLGRVIENVSGQTYEAYVQQHVLKPIGIERMRIGGTRLENRIEGEVRYYDAGTGRSVFADDLGRSVPHPYGAWHLEAMDSHGGWVASAVDLARFVTALDDFDNCPLLCRASIETMFGRPNGEAGADPDGKPKDVFYALGWQVRDLGDGRYNRWHTGSLPGTTTIMIRRHDGRNFVGLLNTRISPAASSLGGDLDREIGNASARVESWPDYDLFPESSKSESSAAVH